jgi:hypothetical protein
MSGGGHGQVFAGCLPECLDSLHDLRPDHSAIATASVEFGADDAPEWLTDRSIKKDASAAEYP